MNKKLRPGVMPAPKKPSKKSVSGMKALAPSSTKKKKQTY